MANYQKTRRYSAYGLVGPMKNLFPDPVVTNRAPTSNDVGYEIGQEWIDEVGNAWYVLTSFTSGVPNWLSVGGSGTFTSLTVNPGPTSLTGATTITGVTIINGTGSTAATSIGNNTTGGIVNILSSSTITVGSAPGQNVNLGSTVNPNIVNIASSTGANTVNIANAQTAGSVSIGTSMTTGSISIGSATATLNIIGQAAAATTDIITLGQGGFKVTPVVPAAGATPRTANGRFGQVAFTDVINAAANANLVVNNTIVATGSTVLANAYCATAGTELTITTITISAGASITFNVLNSGGSNTAANIIIHYWILS